MAVDADHRQGTAYRYRFGAAEFDEAAFELKVGGIPIDVQRKPLEILAVLLRHAGEIVTKDELLDTVWANVSTVENVLANAINKLRSALGDTNAQRIVTTPRVGYRFDGPVDRVAVGRVLASALDLAPGAKAPGRENFILAKLIGRSMGSEVWTARQGKSGEIRVYKFSPDGEHLAALKREATLSRVLRGALGARDDIVRILDWNFETPPFFLECEFGGPNLAEWAAEGDRLRGMALPDRIGIFLQIADALAAAHSVGVLHKDLKPTNILVAPKGEGWQVRLTDFGSGRLLEPGRLAELGITQYGMTMTEGAGGDSSSGTPLYLAPEIIAGETATVKSDVYALGLILYQIVVADFRRPLVSGWVRDISDELLRADIALATDGDPGRRLDSAAELARRLRSLDDRREERRRRLDAEEAARIATEAMKRSRARRPWLIATMAALAVGLAVSLTLYFQVRRDEHRIAAEVETSRTLTSFLTDDLIDAADPEATGHSDVTVAAAAITAAAKIDDTLKTQPPEIRAALHLEMQKVFLGMHNYKAALTEGDLALAAFDTQDGFDAQRAVATQLGSARALVQLSRLPEAQERLDRVKRLVANGSLAGTEEEAWYWQVKATQARASFDLPNYIRASETAWALARRMPNLSPRLRDDIELTLADGYRISGKLPEAEAGFRDLLAREVAEHGEGDMRPQFASVALAAVLGAEKHEDEAIGMLQRAMDVIDRSIGPDSQHSIDAKNILAGIYFEKKKYADAASLWEEISAPVARRMGDKGLFYLAIRTNLADALHLEGKTEAAEQIFRQTLATARALFPPTNPGVEEMSFRLADCMLDLERPDEVGPLLQGLTPDVLYMGTPAPDWELRLAYDRARLALMKGDKPRARDLLAQAAGIIAAKNPDSPITKDRIEALSLKATNGGVSETQPPGGVHGTDTQH